jgi:hypothetical protein
MSKIDGYKMMKIISKFGVKKWRYKLTKKCAKNQFSRGGSTGAKIVKNRPRGPGTPKTEFFEISHFFAKTPHFSTPKIDPYK